MTHEVSHKSALRNPPVEDHALVGEGENYFHEVDYDSCSFDEQGMAEMVRQFMVQR